MNDLNNHYISSSKEAKELIVKNGYPEIFRRTPEKFANHHYIIL